MLSKVVAQRGGGRRKKRASMAAAAVKSSQVQILQQNNNNVDSEANVLLNEQQKKTSPHKKKKTSAPKKSPVESHKITEYFPVRRSERKTGKQIEKEESAALADAIFTGSAEKEILVYTTEDKGRGCKSTRSYKKNDFVLEYKGDMITYEEAKIREVTYSQDPSIGSYMYFFRYKNKKWCIDATQDSPYKGRLVNHSCLRPNLKTKVVEFAETHHLILVAARDIEPDEELLYDYGDRTAATIAENPWLVSS